MDLQTLKRQFLEHLEIEKGRSLKTIANYDHYLTRFLDFSKITDPKGITDDVIREFRLWLNRQEVPFKRAGYADTLKKKTQNYYLIALRAFLKYLARRNITSLRNALILLRSPNARLILYQATSSNAFFTPLPVQM